MSKLPKAPLVEVIFEARWTPATQSGEDVGLLTSDIYPFIKDDFPNRKTVQPLPLPGLANLRFESKTKYPLVQVGNGVLTLNTIDEFYEWEKFEVTAISLIENLAKLSPIESLKDFNLSLHFLDVITFEFDKIPIQKYFSENLNMNFDAPFLDNEKIKQIFIALDVSYDIGTMTINIGKGKNLKGEDGILIQTHLKGNILNPKIPDIRSWLTRGHELCSNSFKNMTKGRLYESFK